LGYRIERRGLRLDPRQRDERRCVRRNSFFVESLRRPARGRSAGFQRLREHRRSGAEQRLVKVRVAAAAEGTAGFVLVLGNGRRVESNWFGEAELARMIRVAEGA